MYTARLICSDPDCAEETLIEAPTLAELERMVCDCGCALEVIGWPDWIGENAAEVIALQFRRGSGDGELPAAA